MTTKYETDDGMQVETRTCTEYSVEDQKSTGDNRCYEPGFLARIWSSCGKTVEANGCVLTIPKFGYG